jgi:hypothetical protein
MCGFETHTQRSRHVIINHEFSAVFTFSYVTRPHCVCRFLSTSAITFETKASNIRQKGQIAVTGRIPRRLHCDNTEAQATPLSLLRRRSKKGSNINAQQKKKKLFYKKGNELMCFRRAPCIQISNPSTYRHLKIRAVQFQTTEGPNCCLTYLSLGRIIKQ